MDGIVVSLNDNVLKVSITDSKGLRGGSRTLDSSIVEGSKIVQQDALADVLAEMINELSDKTSKKLPLNFLVEPQDTYLSFVTVSKKDADIQQKIIEEVSEKLEGVDFADLYFSYQKIAPFVYQFIGIKQEKLEQYLKLSTMVGRELLSVTSWIALLPKLLPDNDPSIFVTKSEGKQVLALSELNGIYFTGVYDKEITPKEIEKLIHDLSVYKRKTPITRVYTVDYDHLDLADGYEIMSLPIPIEGLVEDDHYKLHILLAAVLNKDIGILATQMNLLTLLPLPAVAKKAPLLVPASAALVALLLIGGLGVYSFYSKDNTSSENPPTVLSETGTKEPTEEKTPQNTQQDTSAEKKEEIAEELNKADLKIRVDNGAGVAGVAASTQATLEELGYVVTDIGNAEGDTRENTLVRFKTSKLKYRELLVNDIKDSFELVLEDELDESAEYDVLLIIGEN